MPEYGFSLNHLSENRVVVWLNDPVAWMVLVYKEQRGWSEKFQVIVGGITVLLSNTKTKHILVYWKLPGPYWLFKVLETLEQCVNFNVIDVILVSLLLTLKTLSGVFILDFEQVSTSRVGSKICISITSYGLMKCHCLHLPSTHYISSVHIISNDIETSKTSVWI